MNSSDFCYWLQGYFELSPGSKLTEEQVKVIREHLNLTMHKVTKETVTEDQTKKLKKALEDFTMPKEFPGKYRPICGTKYC